MMTLKEQVCHDHGIDLFKLEREWDPRWAIEREQAQGLLVGPFHRQYLLERAPESLRKALQPGKVAKARQGFTSADQADFPSANVRAAINTTTTETNLWDPSIHAPLPVGEIRGGKAWQLEFGGIMGTTATPTIAFRARCGTNNSAPPTGTDLGLGPTMTLGTISAQPWYGAAMFGCRSIGVAASTATLTGNGFVICPGAAAATTVATCVFGGAVPSTIDQTVAQGLAVSVIWGASSASNTITTQWMFFRSAN